MINIQLISSQLGINGKQNKTRIKNSAFLCFPSKISTSFVRLILFEKIKKHCYDNTLFLKSYGFFNLMSRVLTFVRALGQFSSSKDEFKKIVFRYDVALTSPILS